MNSRVLRFLTAAVAILNGNDAAPAADLYLQTAEAVIVLLVKVVRFADISANCLLDFTDAKRQRYFCVCKGLPLRTGSQKTQAQQGFTDLWLMQKKIP